MHEDTEFGIFILCAGIIALCFLIGMGIWGATVQKNLFNERHDTSYTYWEWVHGQDMIKDYFYGERKKIDLEVIR